MRPTFDAYFDNPANAYRRFRPSYPPALFKFLAANAPRQEVALDIGAGNGQAAAGLAHYFQHVFAIEANAEQTSHALPTAGVHFHVAPAEDTGVKDGCADLVTVAQALHRLDRPAFFDEAARILRPGGLLAVWRYGKMAIHPPIDVILERYYEDVLAPYWEDDLDAIEAAYTTGDLPFEALPAPDFPMRTKWTLDEVLGYLETWSASRAFRAANGHFATDTIRPAIAELWGEETRREIDWPLRVAVRRKPA